MKKVAVYFMLAIVLIGTFTPCCLWDNCQDHELTTALNIDDEADDRDTNNCSPFFSCGSCAKFNYTTYITSIPKLPGTLIEHVARTKTLYYPTYATSFWQPPKIC